MAEKQQETLKYQFPDNRGYYGEFGGKFVPETLAQALAELESGYRDLAGSSQFRADFQQLLEEYAGRPTNLYHARRLTGHYGKAEIFLKREDMLHTGAHKINNALGQVLLAKRMGKQRIIAETGAGQHGVATATACALMGLECVVYMGEEDIIRQELNVFRMNLLGAKVEPVGSGSKTLKDATNEAIRDWVTNVRNTHYVIGSVVGPHPYPMMVRDFQSVIGIETRDQCLRQLGRLPSCVVACVGGGSNAMGIFYPFIADAGVRLVGVEAAGRGLDSGEHAASLLCGTKGILHGSLNQILQEHGGQVRLAHSVSAGLDYPGVGPEHCYLKSSGRAEYAAISDQDALKALKLLCELEGILPALESAHALAHLDTLSQDLTSEDLVVVCLSGRGDKDVYSVAKEMGVPLGER